MKEMKKAVVYYDEDNCSIILNFEDGTDRTIPFDDVDKMVPLIADEEDQTFLITLKTGEIVGFEIVDPDAIN